MSGGGMGGTGGAGDREVVRSVWQGRIPCCLTLSVEEELHECPPHYLLVPRLSYLTLLLDKVRKHFVRHVAQELADNEMWLEYDGLPLKWHYPVGLLHDLLVGPHGALPWTLTVHFDGFPHDTIIPCPNKEVVESHFMSSIKEADVLKHRGQVVSGMQKKDHNQLWLGLLNDKFDQFWAVNKRLMEPTGDQDTFKYIPVRLYSEEIGGPMLQKLVKPTTESGSRATLADMLNEIFPDKNDVKIITHGIVVPPETPLQWMSEHLSYPDNFLHLCVC